VYLQHGQMIPEDRLAQLFDDVFGLNIAPRTLVAYGSYPKSQIVSGSFNETR
jgi:hypothetical protein